jgi:sugar-specific transcriptional regulator TrmB
LIRFADVVPLKECDMVSDEELLKTLARLGLKEIDVEIYLLLTREGSQEGKDIAETLSLYKQELYRSLKRLQRKGMVDASLERPARFSARSLEKVLDCLIEAKKERALTLQQSKEDLISSWKATVKKECENS